MSTFRKDEGTEHEDTHANELALAFMIHSLSSDIVPAAAAEDFKR